MLAVYDESVAKCPEGLLSQTSEGGGADGDDDSLMKRLRQHLPSDSVSVNLGPSSGFMAYSSLSQDPLHPRSFAVVHDVFCLFKGHIENIAPLKQVYGLTKTANEVSIVIEAYRCLRDRGPDPADHVLRNIKGNFVFSIFDCLSKSMFIASDADGSIPFYWGTDSARRLVLTDDEEIIRKACGRSYAPFPKGCFFTSSGGLKSFEHPMKELKAVPWVDSTGQVCGATYVVGEEECKKETTGVPRVASDANWSQKY